jgi:hypothetical protein
MITRSRFKNSSRDLDVSVEDLRLDSASPIHTPPPKIPRDRSEFTTPSNSLPNYPPILESIPIPPTLEEPISEVFEEVAPIFATVFLRTPTHTPYLLYCAELERSITMMVINKNISGVCIFFNLKFFSS